jgi:hypothetical protein
MVPALTFRRNPATIIGTTMTTNPTTMAIRTGPDNMLDI